jgi:hypothetical protein
VTHRDRDPVARPGNVGRRRARIDTLRGEARVAIAGARRDPLVETPVDELLHGEVDADLELSDLDHLTLARATPVVERGLDRDGGVPADHRVDETAP